MGKQSVYPGVDNDRMNNKHQSTLSNYKNTMDSDGENVKDQAHVHKGPTGKTKSDSPMHTKLMNWTEIRESMNTVLEAIDELQADPMEAGIDEPGDISQDSDKKSLINELNQIFTPILVMQGFEQGTVEKIQEAMSEGCVLTEKNIIQFDDESRMAQLISVCCLLIEKQKNSEKFQTYQKAATIRNQMKLEIQKDNYEAGKALAQEYLVNVISNNGSAVARNAAQALLPQTQH